MLLLPLPFDRAPFVAGRCAVTSALRRELTRAACVAAVGLGLGVALAAGCQRHAVVGVATWLSGGRAWMRPVVAVPALPEDERLAADRMLLPELRALVREGRAVDALARAETYVASGESSLLMRVEAKALSRVVEGRERGAPRASSEAGDRAAVSVQRDPAFVDTLFAFTPDGLGVRGDPGREHAAAFLWEVLIEGGVEKGLRDEVVAALADRIGDDAGALVGVLSVLGSLRTLVTDEPETWPLTQALANLDGLVCQAVLDRADATPLRGGLAEAARDGARSVRERAFAAMALAQLADLPVALGRALPLDDAEAAAYPIAATLAAWESVRGLPVHAAFVMRIRIALRELRRPESDGASVEVGTTTDTLRTWLRAHLGGVRGGPRGRLVEVADRIVAGELDPLEHLTASLSDAYADSPADVLRAMEKDTALRLPLHHLLTLQGAAGTSRAPQRTAWTQWSGIVMAWRRVLGFADAPWILRVARLDRRLDGLTLVDETRHEVFAGQQVVLSWTGRFRDDTRPSLTWDPPGTLVESAPCGDVRSLLRMTLTWSDDGARVTLNAVESVTRYPGGGSAQSMSGGNWQARLPMVLTPFAGSPTTESRRAFLITAEPTVGVGVDGVDSEEGVSDLEDFTLDDWRRRALASFARAEGSVRRLGARFARRDSLQAIGSAFALLRPEFDYARLDALWPVTRSSNSTFSRAMAFAGQRVLVVDTPGGQPTPSEAARALYRRDVAELALDAPVKEVRDAMAWLLSSEKRPRGALADELIEFAAAEPGRLPDAVVVAAKAALAKDAARSGDYIFRNTAYVLWGLGAMFLFATIVRLRRPHGARGTAAMLLVVAILIAEMRIVIGGVDYLPASAGWALAALAVWCVGRGRAENQVRVAAGAFAVAAVGSVLGTFVGVMAEIVSSVAALVGCLAIAALTPALLRGLAPRGTRDTAPRRPVRGSGWRLAVRATVGALLAGGVVIVAMSQSGGRSAAVMLFAAPVLALCGGVVLWRIHLARGDRATALPLLFVVGLAVPTLVLLCGQVGVRLWPDAGSRMLPDPLDSIAYTSMAAALAFVLLRNLDAARVRGRADAAHAAASD